MTEVRFAPMARRLFDPAPLGATIVVDAAIAFLMAAFELVVQGMEGDETTLAVSFDVTAIEPAVTIWIVAVYVPLLWRQRSPVAVLAAVSAVRIAAEIFFGSSVGWLGLLATLYATAAVYALPIAGAALALGVVVEHLGYELEADDPTVLQRLGAIALSAGILAVPWGLGLLSRTRAERQAERERQRVQQRGERARRAVADERERMARELHDILAHSISVMVLQASGGREVLAADRARAGVALEQIEATGRQSLIEVRRLLGLLHDQAPEHLPASEPGLARLDSLVREVSEAGISVTVDVEGAPPSLAPSIDLAAYRIVQEALTNVLKHAPGAAARVRLSFRDEVLELEVTDSGKRLREWSVRTGKGLVGMQERASLVGGQLEAGPGAERGFRVCATLPVAAAEHGQ